MKIIKNRILLLVLILLPFISVANNDDQPKGNAIIQIFSNFHTGLFEQNDIRGFEMDRCYLGYEYKLNSGLLAKAVMDIGAPAATTDDYNRLAYIKFAQISWTRNNFNLQAGIIPTLLFGTQDKFWGYRYIMQSVQGEYKFGNSADLGISTSYKIADWISADAIIVNGEGYKKIQKKDGLLYGLGTTIEPLKGMMIRLYANINEDVARLNNITNYAMLLGYKNKTFSIGAEYNMVRNLKFIANNDKEALSVYGTLFLGEKNKLFARVDKIESLNELYQADDEIGIILGSEFKIGKYINLAPNFRMYIPAENNLNNKYMLYLSARFNI